ncbi:glycosyltransferase family protein [Ornithinimicrobium cerasi]|uniref:Predicted glycosyl transferase n=1 Tax=Ornithinimicrobium cerasi TaxID=2248773 RepID=A0A285VW51_9MICO|nr:glycosyltransferase [Ornithinimicrobium cerasi]SOC56861.1 Predicted glycosyl transferase [Ornithinimicrobium cerasi]
MDEALRVVFSSHDSQGLGHFRRNRALAHAVAARVPELTGRAVTGLLVNGVGGASGMSTPPGFDVVTVPAIGKTGHHYGARHLGVDLDEVTALRGEIVRATLQCFAPDLLVVDRHALGVDGELLPALVALREQVPAAHVVLGLREVLDSPAGVAAEWEGVPPGLVRALFDEVWVYGDPRVHDLRVTGELPRELADLVTFHGYLSRGRAEDAHGLDPQEPYVVTTAGGGSDGAALCLVAAATPVPEGHTHVVVTGPQMSEEEHREVVRAAVPRTRVVQSVPDAAGLIRRAAASVSMAGYNTVAETLATGVPALLVPREQPRQEQLIRASGLAAVGAADLLRQRDLTPARLAAWWGGAVGRRVNRAALDLGGLRSVARRTAEIATSRLPRAATATPATATATPVQEVYRAAV